MLVDLSCPAEIFRTALPTEGIPAVSMIMYNLSDRVITSAEVTAVLLSVSGEEIEKVTFRGRALNGRPHATFNMNVPMAPDKAARQVRVRIDKIWFSDNDIWRREAGTETDYIPNDLLPSPALMNLKYAAGENAVGYPSQQEGLWVCVCGRPNPDRMSVCARCRQEKAAVFSLFSPEAVARQIALREKQLELNTRSVREDTARLQRIREKEYEEKKANHRRRTGLVIALAIFLLLTAGVLGGAVPALRLVTANQAMAGGNYEEARETLQDLEGFSGVPEKVAECDWQILAREANRILGKDADADLSEEPDPEALKKISRELREMADREEARQLADEADLRRAQMLLEEARAALAREMPASEETEENSAASLYRDGIAISENDPDSLRCRRLLEEARKAVSLLDRENPDRVNLELACLYTEAQDAMNRRNYLTARETLLSLGHYESAGTLATECLYQQGLMQLEVGMYPEAIDIFLSIMDYRDSRNRILQCHYMIGEQYAEEGKLEEACNEYLQAGEWSSAKAKLQATTYRMAEEAYQAGDYETALTLCASIPGHADADRMNYDCRYRLGKAAFKEAEYTRAYRMFSGLPEGYETDSDDLRIQSAYHAGKLAMELENWELAAELLTAAGSYRDAARQLEKVKARLEETVPGTEPTSAPEETPAPEETAAPETPAVTETPEPAATETPEPTPTAETTPVPPTPVPDDLVPNDSAEPGISGFTVDDTIDDDE